MTGAERFLKTMASTGVQMIGKKISPVYAAPVPEFQALPSSIASAQFIQPTRVEYYPKDDNDELKVDLKGHTVEELAAAANVSVETIKAAIKVRQQQMLIEKKTSTKPKWKKTSSIATTSVKTTQSTTSESTEKLTTQSATTTKPSTTPYVPKKKVVAKKAIKNGHKVRFISDCLYKCLQLFCSTGHECTQGILSNQLR